MTELKKKLQYLENIIEELREEILETETFNKRYYLSIKNTDLAIYHDTIYKLVYNGLTKWGYRAKLLALDNTISFWVDSSKIIVIHKDDDRFFKQKSNYSYDEGDCEYDDCYGAYDGLRDLDEGDR